MVGMRSNFLNFLIALAISYGSYAQSVPPSYEVAPWQGFRSAAISYTFDDLTPKQIPVAVPMFNEYGFQLTLYPVTNWSPDWKALQTVVSQGHEVGSHTISHTSLSSLSDGDQETELQQSQQTINTKLTMQRCVTLAYPYCATGKDALVRKYYIAARICSGVIEKKTPTNMMQISSIICGSQGSVKTSADFKARADAAASSNGWCVYLLHGIDNDGGYSQLSSDTLRKSLEYLKMYPDKFWVTSFGTVARYIYERNCVSIVETYTSQDTIVFTVQDTLDNGIFNVPLTIRRKLPDSWENARVYFNGNEMMSYTTEINGLKSIIVNVVPDQGELTLVRYGCSRADGDIQQPRNMLLITNYPNPFNPTTTIVYSVPSQSFIELTISNMVGQELITLYRGEQHAGTYQIVFDGSLFPSGLYLCRLKRGHQVVTKKLLLVK